MIGNRNRAFIDRIVRIYLGLGLYFRIDVRRRTRAFAHNRFALLCVWIREIVVPGHGKLLIVFPKY